MHLDVDLALGQTEGGPPMGGLWGLLVLVVLVIMIWAVAVIGRRSGSSWDDAKLPHDVQRALSTADCGQREAFWVYYNRKQKNIGPMLATAVFLPGFHLLLLERIGLWVAFVLTAGGLGVWYLTEWFLVPRRVAAYNQEVAVRVAEHFDLL